METNYTLYRLTLFRVVLFPLLGDLLDNVVLHLELHVLQVAEVGEQDVDGGDGPIPGSHQLDRNEVLARRVALHDRRDIYLHRGRNVLDNAVAAEPEEFVVGSQDGGGRLAHTESHDLLTEQVKTLE